MRIRTEAQLAARRAQCRRSYHKNKEANKEALGERRRAWQRANTAKTLVATQKWQRANPEKVKAAKLRQRAQSPEKFKTSRRQQGLRVYGISIIEYELLLALQGGLCAICKNPPSIKHRLSVDHCHIDHKVRGLLCDNCNNGLGRFKDSPDLLLTAIAYLQMIR